MDSLIGAWDYAIMIMMLVVSVGIGFYYRFTSGKNQTIRVYLFADKSMSTIPTAISLMASYLSSLSLLGIPVEVYKFGIVVISLGFLYPLSSLFISYYILPVFFMHEVSTPFEYLYKRFGYPSQVIVSLMFTIQMILFMGVVLYAPSIALETVIGINELSAILIAGGTCLLYSALGGMKAVIVADVFQALMMFIAVFAVLISAIIDIGGVVPFWTTAKRGQRLNLFDFNLDPTEIYTLLPTIVCGGVVFMIAHATNQTQVQRYLAVKDLSAAKRALWFSAPLSTIYLVLCGTCGLAVYARYHDCDPVKSGRIRSSDQLVPLYIADAMNGIPGLTGLVITGIFSGLLSSLSSVMNGLAGSTITDYINPIYKICMKKELDEKKATILVKVLAVLYGLIIIMAASMAKYFGGIIKAAMLIYGAVGGPIFGIFILGMFYKSCNQIGALTGYITGNIITFWIAFGGPRPPPRVLSVSIEGCVNNNLTISFGNQADPSEYFWLYRISYIYTGLIGVVITLVVGIITSLIYRGLHLGDCRSGKQNAHLCDTSETVHQLDKLLEPKTDPESFGVDKF